MQFNECEESDEKGAVDKQNKLQVIDEYNKRNRNNKPKVDNTYKCCMTRKQGTCKRKMAGR